MTESFPEKTIVLLYIPPVFKNIKNSEQEILRFQIVFLCIIFFTAFLLYHQQKINKITLRTVRRITFSKQTRVNPVQPTI